MPDKRQHSIGRNEEKIAKNGKQSIEEVRMIIEHSEYGQVKKRTIKST